MLPDKRAQILAQLARYTGQIVSAGFIQRTSQVIPEIDRFHNLLSGIYKPAGSPYALAIIMKRGSPYEHKDDVVFLDDGRWLMTYSPRSGGLDISDNRALVKCWDEKAPLAVFQQLTSKADGKSGSSYRVLGLAMVTDYDARGDVFIVESADLAALTQVTSSIVDERTRYETQLYARLTNKFSPFVRQENATYIVSSPRRDEAFRHVLLYGYDFTCAVCGMKFRLGELAEATAAHIIPKRREGTDDPRNGLALCRTHHWAFDAGVFSVTDDYRVELSAIVRRAETANFGLVDMAGQPLLPPQNEALKAHSDALAWHRNNVLLR